jgi:diaminohydroxyphosphoribosylaminopyrimidine deaminase / 5-amino-6-(5-phosphoribosylamino)uracil reductase
VAELESGHPEANAIDEGHMARAMALAASVRRHTAPNPWVGCVIVAPAASGNPSQTFEGVTNPPGGGHAEVVALEAAATHDAARGATLYTTLEPCSHFGRTPPCVSALVESGIARVVVGCVDPDPKVAGRGIAALRAGGIEVVVGVLGDLVAEQLAPYLKHRRSGRPWVVLKVASTLDGRSAAPDGTSQWISGPESRADAHQLRADSDAILVGAGTVRSDDPQLTVRSDPMPSSQPLRVVLGQAPPSARVHPALELQGPLEGVLDDLGARGVLQVLVEGGPRVAHDFHAAGLVDRYVFYIAPALFGGSDATSLFEGKGAPTIDALWRARLVSVSQLGQDLRVEIAA